MYSIVQSKKSHDFRQLFFGLFRPDKMSPKDAFSTQQVAVAAEKDAAEPDQQDASEKAAE